MTTKEFQKIVHKDLKSAKYTQKQTESNEIIAIVLNAVSDSLIKGHNIELHGFGSFNLTLRNLRNLAKNGAPVQRWICSFKLSKSLTKKINKDIIDEERKAMGTK